MKTRYKICGCVIALVLLMTGSAGGYFHFHWNVSATAEKFTESSIELQNPNRGFYYIYGFWIKDESVDYTTLVKQKFANDTDTTLALIEINLQEYRNGKISDAGLQNIKKLFDALRQENKTYLVRFLYDWDGKNQLYEPDSIDIILNHMKQVKSVLRENADIIFSLQGLFVGNWGEMNGTKYVDQKSLRTLAKQYLDVSDKTTYLSVRMPAQWRIIIPNIMAGLVYLMMECLEMKAIMEPMDAKVHPKPEYTVHGAGEMNFNSKTRCVKMSQTAARSLWTMNTMISTTHLQI